MKLHHIALWTQDIERLSGFYVKHCEGKVLFSHQIEDFRCLFLEIFSDLKIEIMNRPNLPGANTEERVGFSHFSVEVSSKDEVNRLTDYFTAQNIPLEKYKEQYDDGFYESAILDPDGNIIEIAYVDRSINPNV